MSVSRNSLRFACRCVAAACALAVTAAVATAQTPPPAPQGGDNTLLVTQLLSDKQAENREKAAVQLGFTADINVIPALARAARNDPSPGVRQQAAQALQKIRGQAGTLVLQPPPGNLWRGRWQQAPQQGDPVVELVASWYHRFLRRAPDEDGMNFWVNKLRNGESESEALAGMLASPEYWSLKGGNRRGFIKGMYTDLLNRSPSAQDVQYWIDRLDFYDDDRQSMAQQFLHDIGMN